MSNFEYDKLYDELAGLEAETGIVLSGSPTQNVGYESQEELPPKSAMNDTFLFWVKPRM